MDPLFQQPVSMRRAEVQSDVSAQREEREKRTCSMRSFSNCWKFASLPQT